MPVRADLSVEEREGVYVLGDSALLIDALLIDLATDRPLPGLAQVAKQQGHHLGTALARPIGHGNALRPFRFQDRGNTAIPGATQRFSISASDGSRAGPA